MVKQHAGESFRCEPALGPLAGSRGIAPAPVPKRVLEPRALFAFAFSGAFQGALPDRAVVSHCSRHAPTSGRCVRGSAVIPTLRFPSSSGPEGAGLEQRFDVSTLRQALGRGVGTRPSR